MWGMNPQQQQWWQHFLQTQAAYKQAMWQHQQQLEPFNQPGFTHFNNQLLNRANVPALSESDPQAGMFPFLMGMSGSDQPGGGINPMMLNLMMGGSQ